MELLVFCSGTGYNVIVLSRVVHVSSPEDLSLSPGVLGDRGMLRSLCKHLEGMYSSHFAEMC